MIVKYNLSVFPLSIFPIYVSFFCFTFSSPFHPPPPPVPLRIAMSFLEPCFWFLEISVLSLLPCPLFATPEGVYKGLKWKKRRLLLCPAYVWFISLSDRLQHKFLLSEAQKPLLNVNLYKCVLKSISYTLCPSKVIDCWIKLLHENIYKYSFVITVFPNE